MLGVPRAALAAEVRRVLHPWYGVAVIGDESGRTATPRLLAWARRIAPDARLLDDVQPPLIAVKAAPLAGADDWPHWWRGPDNNAVSTDTAFGLPESVQWTGKPFFSTRLELPLVAGGRLFMLWYGHEMDSSPGTPRLGNAMGQGPLLTARTTGSGVRLWARRLSPSVWATASRAVLVADRGELLVADGGRIVVLDRASGAANHAGALPGEPKP